MNRISTTTITITTGNGAG
ncbi:thr operon leader peptide [Salmonella enterica]|nr:thr operon leader peptide [Salmonella enterica]EBK2663580.1 thr operon leader peptide [Salmonella enterica subsp. enterica serovar Enteritidis]ECR2649825.1 thr operon leader peptide [Salmonella enterica subsp. enterica]EKM9997647.1 thr operon leader peptide [Salmonella enterica subsp. enterica serovar Alachua]ELN8563141.1 thr operon leader peptide [Salmonella enterica subsp. enterica serovar Eppendorf]EAB4411573.1 thr operon leader peptide [Salmonella enterica]